jgi:tetratricopeptide (TPR) repeat protein
LTFALYQQGSHDEALASAQHHLAIATEAGDLAGVSIALNHTGLVRLDMGLTTEALALLQQAFEMASRAHDRRVLLHAANNLGHVHWRRGEHIEAVACWRQALPVALEIGDRQTAAIVIGNMGGAYLEQGDHDSAVKCFVQALQVSFELRDWTNAANQVANLAMTLAAQGQVPDAEAVLVQAISLARVLDAPYFLCDWLHELAKLLVRQSRLDEADRISREALEVAEEHGDHDVVVRASLLSLRLQVTLGRLERSAALRQLETWAGNWTADYELAAVLDTVWSIDRAQENARVRAAELYRSLHERAPTREHREAVERLTGTAPPPARPLPPLPEAIGEEAVDFLDLLRDVDVAARRLVAS